MTTLIVATRNRHKLQEIRAILSEQYTYRSLADLSAAPEITEDAPDFAGNATKKAVALAEWLSQGVWGGLGAVAETGWVLADDSGLEVDALGGAPGVHSARFAALDRSAGNEGASKSNPVNSSDQANNAKLLRLMATVPLAQRAARFRCVLAVVGIAPNGTLTLPQMFEGVCEGHIDFAPRGSGGFGYDPLFVPQGYEQSFAELSPDLKNQLSHRARALAGLGKWLANRQSGH